MMMLVTLTMLGSVLGAASGVVSSGTDGLILGSAIGFITGVTIWSLVSMSAQWQHERRLNQYFNNISHEELD
jgi:hypothetical protein